MILHTVCGHWPAREHSYVSIISSLSQNEPLDLSQIAVITKYKHSRRFEGNRVAGSGGRGFRKVSFILHNTRYSTLDFSLPNIKL